MGSRRCWLKVADEENKCIPHVFPRSHWLKAIGQCLIERYLLPTMFYFFSFPLFSFFSLNTAVITKIKMLWVIVRQNNDVWTMSHKGELYKAGLFDTGIFNFGISFGLVLAFTRKSIFNRAGVIMKTRKSVR